MSGIKSSLPKVKTAAFTCSGAFMAISKVYSKNCFTSVGISTAIMQSFIGLPVFNKANNSSILLVSAPI